MIDTDKIINSKCICKNGLPWIKENVIMLDPCEHLIHHKCFTKLKTTKCPYCKFHITRIISSNDFKYNPLLYQKCIDIISVSNFDNMSKIYTDKVLFNLPNLIGTILKIPFTRGIEAGKKLCSDILSMNNIEIKVKGLNKIKSGQKVFIANHTSHLDFFAIFYILETSFLSSSVIRDNIVSNQLSNVLPLLIVDRGKVGENTVDKMRNYVKENGSICLFPEGMITHPDTIIRFRTGAFNIGYPVYPIVLKYRQVIADMSTKNFILKMASQQKEFIEMQILDPFYPPFDENKIELVRHTMAKKGKMAISRVSNRDITDKN